MSERYPSKPEPFGYKMTWLAIRNADPFELLHEINIRNEAVSSANWRILEKIYHWDITFISPAIDEWTFVISPSLGDLSSNTTLTFLKHLSTKFPEVQFFGNHRVVNYGAWGKLVNGVSIRIFSISDGTISINEGPLTEVENRLIARKKQNYEDEFDFPVEDVEWLGDEDDVMEMAGQWSINPQILDNYPETFALGLIIFHQST